MVQAMTAQMANIKMSEYRHASLRSTEMGIPLAKNSELLLAKLLWSGHQHQE